MKSIPVLLLQMRSNTPKMFEILDKIISFSIKILPLFLFFYISYTTYLVPNVNKGDTSVIINMVILAIIAYFLLKLLQKIIHYKTGNVFKTSIRFSVFGIIISLGRGSILKCKDEYIINELDSHERYRGEKQNTRKKNNSNKVEASKDRMKKYEQRNKEYERSRIIKEKEKEIRILQDKNKQQAKATNNYNKDSILRDYHEAQIEENNKKLKELGESIGGLK